MYSYVGHLCQPPLRLSLEILVVDEGPTVEKVLPYVADRTLHLALGFGPIRPAGSSTELPVMGKAKELHVLHQGAALQTLVFDDHRAHLVKEQFPRHAAKILEGLLQPCEQRSHVLASEEPQPQKPGVAQDHQQSPAATPGQTKVREVNLPLVARRCLETNHRFSLCRTNMAHVFAQLRIATLIAGCANLLVNPHGAQQWVLLQPRLDDRAIGINLPCHRGTFPVMRRLFIQIPVQLTCFDPVIDCPAADSQRPGQGTLGPSLLNVFSQNHTPLPSVHRHLQLEGDQCDQRASLTATASEGRLQKQESVQFSSATFVQFTPVSNICRKSLHTWPG